MLPKALCAPLLPRALTRSDGGSHSTAALRTEPGRFLGTLQLAITCHALWDIHWHLLTVHLRLSQSTQSERISSTQNAETFGKFRRMCSSSFLEVL